MATLTKVETLCDICEKADTKKAPVTTYRIGVGAAQGRVAIRLVDLHEACFPDVLNELIRIGRKPE